MLNYTYILGFSDLQSNFVKFKLDYQNVHGPVCVEFTSLNGYATRYA
jgi:hypothetical protein